MPDPSFIRRRFVILISGQGSNMQSIARACLSGLCPADVVAVISNRPEAAGLAWAAERGIHTEVVAHRDFATRDAFDHKLSETIERFAPDYVLLAGFMRVLTPGFVERYSTKLINIHPSLLPSFPGLHTHSQALAKGVQVHGCTVHFVTPVLDHGPIVAQGVVPVLATDSPESLAERVLSIEHTVYAKVAIWLAQGRVHLLPDQRVTVDDVASRMFYPELHK